MKGFLFVEEPTAPGRRDEALSLPNRHHRMSIPTITLSALIGSPQSLPRVCGGGSALHRFQVGQQRGLLVLGEVGNIIYNLHSRCGCGLLDSQVQLLA